MSDTPLVLLAVSRQAYKATLVQPMVHEIVRRVIAFGQRFGKTVTAEGLETQGQLDALNMMGCDVTQGFLLGKPAQLGPYFYKFEKVLLLKTLMYLVVVLLPLNHPVRPIACNCIPCLRQSTKNTRQVIQFFGTRNITHVTLNDRINILAGPCVPASSGGSGNNF
jgi:hypothetical protein